MPDCTKVEKDKGCQEMIKSWFSHHCIYGDIMDLITNKVPTDTLLEPSKIRFKSAVPCIQHHTNCPLPFGSKDKNSLGVLGSPCVLFSKKLGMIKLVACVRG